jgi:hypothetical protein
MLRRRILTVAITFTAGLVLVVPLAARQAARRSPALTALDYIQIQQLVYRYGWALDSGGDNGYAYADLYTPDGIFVGTNQGPSGRSYQGRERLAALSRGGRRGPLFVSHYVTNVIVEPAADGAIGHTYVAIFNLGEDGKPSAIDHGGRYDDVYARTKDGWKFRKRTFYESKSGDPVQPPPAALAPLAPLAAAPGPARKTVTKSASIASALTAQDYLEIQQLVSRYPYALDGDTDNGESYANLFTDDAVFSRPVTTGHDKLEQLAASQPHGPNYARHFITNHVIDPAAGGAVGKEYLVVIDIGTPPGQPSSVFLMGHYDDRYEKTTRGWRFKTRTFVSAKAGTAGSPDAAPAGR